MTDRIYVCMHEVCTAEITELIPGNCMWLGHLPILRQALLFTQIDTLALELLASLVATTAGCATGAKLDNKGNQTESRTNPHQCEHLHPDVSLDVEIWVCIGEDLGEDGKHDCCYCRGNDGN